MPPRTLGAYEILAIVGRGGIGTVYRARHREHGQEVALKLLAPPPACEPTAARRLAREFEALQELDHPNVVRVYEAGVHEGYSFLAMELVEGLDLRSYLSPLLDDDLGGRFPPVPALRAVDLEAWSEEPDTESLFAPVDEHSGTEALRAFATLLEEPETGTGFEAPGHDEPEKGKGEVHPLAEPRPIPPELALRLNGPGRLSRLRDALRQVCEGLSYVHARGLVHRDLKPSNIMVDDRRRVRLMDFGLVKLASDALHLTQHGKVVGTYRYMAPEQARGEPVDQRADLYSLGVILFELLCGRTPFSARRAPELWDQIIGRPPPDLFALNPGADPRLVRLALRLLAKDPRERPQSAGEVAREVLG